jgi:hypothetical protein
MATTVTVTIIIIRNFLSQLLKACDLIHVPWDITIIYWHAPYVLPFLYTFLNGTADVTKILK